jgi:hypothetical protein
MAKKKKASKAPVAPRCSGGDILARGAAGTSMTFPSCSHVKQKQYDLAFLTKRKFILVHGEEAYERALNGDFN